MLVNVRVVSKTAPLTIYGSHSPLLIKLLIQENADSRIGRVFTGSHKFAFSFYPS